MAMSHELFISSNSSRPDRVGAKEVGHSTSLNPQCHSAVGRNDCENWLELSVRKETTILAQITFTLW